MKTKRLCFLLIAGFLAGPALGYKSVYEWAITNLNFARDEKIEQLERFCNNIHSKARAIRDDEMMLDFFDANLQFIRFANGNRDCEGFQEQLDEFSSLINRHYISNYISFYDILFVTLDGEIIYTLRKEGDYCTNLFTGDLKDSVLSRKVKAAGGEEGFVDFFYYPSSDEPAAFFIEPALKNGEQLGWFVLQIAINKINSLFAGIEELGITGETFLVNRQGFLLTESSFVGNATILKMRLDDRNICSKFAAKKGNKKVTDYRGFKALTSFEVFEFIDTEWLVVAKIDEAEVLTNHYRNHPKYFYQKISTKLSEGVQCDNCDCLFDSERKQIMVDMDEFVKADHGEVLKTVGVSSCTALIATYPGKFGYLAHISPYDKMYGNSGTNVLGKVVKKIKHYDIYEFERRRVRFTVAATHLNSMNNIINKLIEEGFLLSQINVLYNPEARSANVGYAYADDTAVVEWRMKDEQADSYNCIVGEENDLGSALKTLVAPK